MIAVFACPNCGCEEEIVSGEGVEIYCRPHCPDCDEMMQILEEEE